MSSSTTDLLPSLLHKCLRVTLTDGRDITGRLYCIDNKENIVLRNAVEKRRRDGEYSSVRKIGIVMIPGKEAVKIGCLKKDFPQ
ncbi:conserved hypothetical protein [Perkinsus marinus ATCC 50983]|uniref:Sm domain-containing protein n=1 Tax=Perkinsus marinus (strain ATCC 50983 / TXsc) TaxID=423536 RepID=C5LLV4_PERM5|nr:conserved hypothetical protein [Perkinsus marinus ATCC 50983]EER02326.1 conserved hypothetical protein [Perkinsus marinus ATCC 50983]|eukprot:XP_002769608.1 conserved hypothetical protein [Perkinsus marinus ATCC 50983]